MELLQLERKIIVDPEECSYCHNYQKVEVQDFQKRLPLVGLLYKG